MKKKIKIFMLVSIFAMPNVAFSCQCYAIFNSGWQAANSSFATCAMNSTSGLAGSYLSGGFGGAGSAGGAMAGFLRCQTTFYNTWDQLGAQFNYCTMVECRIE